VDKSKRTVTFTYDNRALGFDSWEGVSFYVTTWDKSGEGTYQPLAKEPSSHTFGGGDEQAPLIMDDVLITLDNAGHGD
jgi:hypothetical protein